jgi:hypothetical protein
MTTSGDSEARPSQSEVVPTIARRDARPTECETRRPVVVALLIFAGVLVVDLYRIFGSLPRAEFGDEWRYLLYARNLLAGFFSPRDRIFLANGPVYPLFLVPFVKLGWLEGARYANAILHALALVYAWLIVSPRVPGPWSLAAVGLLYLYLPTAEFLPLLYTEMLCFFLVAALAYHVLKVQEGGRHLVLSGVFLGILSLTKVIFGYVSAAFLLAAMVISYRRGAARHWRALALSSALALGLSVPYLGYTYSLTGRLFYWSSVGTNSFYWLSTPYPEEVGDWYHQGWVRRDPILRAHHLALFDMISGVARDPNLSIEEQLLNLSTPEAADAFGAIARRNVRQHPLKFAKNWLYNVARMFLDVPVSVRDTPFWNRYSQAHLLLLGFTAYVGVRARRARTWPSPAFVPLFLFAGLGMAAYSLSSATARFLFPIVPLWWLGTCCWLARVWKGPAAIVTSPQGFTSSSRTVPTR